MSLFSKLKYFNEPQPESAKRRKNYKAIKILGHGAFGVVKEVVDLSSGVHVAMKSVKKSGNEEKRAKIDKMFNRETTILKNINHPNIVSLLDFFETREKYYMIFELATGGELFDRLSNKGHFTETDAATIIYQILQGLSIIHEHHIVHRDIKPENILYKTESPDAPVMIADFGVSQEVEEGEELLHSVAGSPGYAAPEIIKRTGHSTSADMWSLGVLTYTILAGYHPFNHCRDLHELLDSITNARFKFHENVWKLLSKRARHFVSSLLKLSPTERLTAEQAKLHPWILKYCPEARKRAEQLERESTIRHQQIQNAQRTQEEQTKEVMKDYSQQDLKTDSDPDEPLNLVIKVWMDQSKFNAKAEWKKAIGVIQAVQSMNKAVRSNCSKGLDKLQSDLDSGDEFDANLDKVQECNDQQQKHDPNNPYESPSKIKRKYESDPDLSK